MMNDSKCEHIESPDFWRYDVYLLMLEICIHLIMATKDIIKYNYSILVSLSNENPYKD